MNFSLRHVPPALYIAIGLGLAGKLTMLALTIAKPDIDTYFKWSELDSACSTTMTVFTALAFFELAKRQVGGARTLTTLAAGLSLSSLLWLGLNIVLAIWRPEHSTLDIFNWVGRFTALLAFTSSLLATLAADAWRRVTIAAVGLMLLHATGYYVPVIGDTIKDLLGHDRIVQLAYGLVRFTLSATCTLFVAAALAMRPVIPDRAAAAAGWWMARGALLGRIAAAGMFALLAIVVRSDNGKLYLLIVGFVATIATMIVFALGVHRASASGVDGMPRWRLALATAATLWCVVLQIHQMMAVYATIKGEDLSFRTDNPTLLTLVGPIVGALALGLVGSSISALAANRGNHPLATSAASRTAIVVVLGLGSVGLQRALAHVESAGAAFALMLGALVAVLAALVVLAGVLRDAAAQLTAPDVPGARVVG